MLGLFRRIYLYFWPPKVGDIYYGDATLFVESNPLEKIRHGMKDMSGDNLWIAVCGKDTYKFTVKSTSMPYLILEAEVLAHSQYQSLTWLKRNQPRRFYKNSFNEMIVNNTLRREK